MSPRFVVGDRVRVREAWPPGHLRTPAYIRGKRGVVCQHVGDFGNPETLAYGGDGRPQQPLYRVHFPQASVWPDYRGPAADSLEVEIYQHWLDPDQHWLDPEKGAT